MVKGMGQENEESSWRDMGVYVALAVCTDQIVK